MTRPTEKQLAEALEPFAKAAEYWQDVLGVTISTACGLWQDSASVRECGLTVGDLRRAAAALAAYRSAQQAEAGAAGELPALPEPDGTLVIYGKEFPQYGPDSVRTYGQQCYEACRQQGMEQARAAASSAQEPLISGQTEVSAPGACLKVHQIHLTEAGRKVLSVGDSLAAPTRMAGAAQGERKPISDEQIDAIAAKHVEDIGWYSFERNDFFACVRAIEAAHGIGTPSTASDEGMPTRCQADRDGDCTHKSCHQLRDGEPRRSGRHCPLDRSEDDDA